MRKDRQFKAEGIYHLGFGVKTGYSRPELEKTVDKLNYGNGLIRNGAFFVDSEGEVCIVLTDPKKAQTVEQTRFSTGVSQ